MASLPEGWTQHVDPASGRTFYHNASTGQSSLELPGQGGAVGAAAGGEAAAAGGAQPDAAAQQAAAAQQQQQLQQQQLLQQQQQQQLLQQQQQQQLLLQQQAAAGGQDPQQMQLLQQQAMAQQQQLLLQQQMQAQQQALMMQQQMGGGMMMQQRPMMQQQMMQQQVQQQPTGPRVKGHVKNWNSEKGYGFIDPIDGQPHDPNDRTFNIFVHRNQLMDGQELIVGNTVEFTVEINDKNGKQQAVQVQGASPKGAGKGDNGGGWQAPNGGKGQGKKDPSQIVGEMKSAVVTAWDSSRGFGFLDPGNGEENVFVHRSCFFDGVELEVGSTVQYQLSWNPKKSMMQGTNLLGAKPGDNGPDGRGPGAPTDGNGEPQQATVNKWFEEKGFGFVVLPSGTECYAHRTVIQDGPCLVPGTIVTVTPEWDPEKTRYKASIVVGASDQVWDANGIPGSKGMDKGKGPGKGKDSDDWGGGKGKGWDDGKGMKGGWDDGKGKGGWDDGKGKGGWDDGKGKGWDDGKGKGKFSDWNSWGGDKGWDKGKGKGDWNPDMMNEMWNKGKGKDKGDSGYQPW